ncbi:MAG: hypothetical protein LQ340_003132, partial [Diploschistes diacapsis]
AFPTLGEAKTNPPDKANGEVLTADVFKDFLVNAGMDKPKAFDEDGNLRPAEFRYSEKQDGPLSKEALVFIL